MRTLPSCVLYSRDQEVCDRLIRISSNLAAIQPIEKQADLEQYCSQFGDTILLADLRAPNCLDILSELKTNRPMSVIIALG